MIQRDRDRAAVRAAHRGAHPKDISDRLGISISTVYRILRDAKYRAAVLARRMGHYVYMTPGYFRDRAKKEFRMLFSISDRFAWMYADDVIDAFCEAGRKKRRKASDSKRLRHKVV